MITIAVDALVTRLRERFSIIRKPFDNFFYCIITVDPQEFLGGFTDSEHIVAPSSGSNRRRK